MCHTTTSWTGATFDHSQTAFPLTGAHLTVQCATCHVGGNFTTVPTACYGCHQADFTGTTNPNHVSSGFPQDCSICHTTTSWANATFDHSTTPFPLTGAHTSVACGTCHVNGNFTTVPTACYGCHQTDFQNTTNPSHTAAGFPQDCSVCHNTTSWDGATFNHANTGFTLTGAHTTTPCLSCHVNNVFAGTPTDCYSCHTTEYQTVTNPNHVSAGFPKTCDTCHTTASWLGAVFNHTQFPIYSGNHRQGVWTTCADCHVNSSDYSVFSCINCHTHNKTSTDQNHSGVRGYVYNSLNCYQCHPTGSGD